MWLARRFAHGSATAQVTRSSVKLYLSPSKVDCFRALWNGIFLQICICASKNGFYCIQNKFSCFFEKMLCWHWCFVSTCNQLDILDPKWIPMSQIITNIETVLSYLKTEAAHLSETAKFSLLQAKGPFAVSSAARASRATKSWHVTSAYTRDYGPTHAQCVASVSGARTTWRSMHARTKSDCLPPSIFCCHLFCIRAFRLVTLMETQDVICCI